jgi:hypothetical protein
MHSMLIGLYMYPAAETVVFVPFYGIQTMFMEMLNDARVYLTLLFFFGAEAANSPSLGRNAHRAKHMRELVETSIWNQRHGSITTRHGRGGDTRAPVD